MQLNPYLIFDGQCAEAFRLYERVLGGRIESMMTHGESPMADQTPAALRDRVMHARLVVDGQVLMASDSPPEQYEEPQGTYISINVDDPGRAEGIFRTLSEGGTVKLPFQKTFWAAGGFGMLVDRFGTHWMVNCEKAG